MDSDKRNIDTITRFHCISLIRIIEINKRNNMQLQSLLSSTTHTGNRLEGLGKLWRIPIKVTCYSVEIWSQYLSNIRQILHGLA